MSSSSYTRSRCRSPGIYIQCSSVGAAGRQAWRACSAFNHVQLDVPGLKHVRGKTHHFVRAELLAGEDINVDHAITRPGVQADMAGGNDHKAGHTIVKRTARFNVL